MRRQAIPWYDGLRIWNNPRMTVAMNEIAKVKNHPGIEDEMVQPARIKKTADQTSSRGRAMRSTLQNKKKWPMVNTMIRPNHG
jgi:hypothetical protein